MKKTVFIIITLVIVFALACSVAMANRPAYEGENVAYKIGTAIKESLSDLWAEYNGMVPLENKLFAVVLDEEISQAYFNTRAALFEATGSKTPELDAWESIKREVAERKFAEEHGLLPTDEEIIAFTQEMRELVESTEESYAIGKTQIEATGLTWEQYWNEFRPRYESPLHIIKINIDQYLKENNLEELDVSSIEYEILNEDYQGFFKK